MEDLQFILILFFLCKFVEKPPVQMQSVKKRKAYSINYFSNFVLLQESQKGIGVDMASEVGDRAVFSLLKGLKTSPGQF